MKKTLSFCMGGLLGALLLESYRNQDSPQKSKLETPIPSEPLILAEEDLVAIPYEQTGGVFSVPITIEQNGRADELWMIFDTGATFSTINRETLEFLGLDISEEAPVVTLRTANGTTKAPLVMLNEVWMGGYWVGPLTVAICESCASSEIAGLLGLNVSSGFLLTLDPLNEEILIQPRGRRRIVNELSHWVSLSSSWGASGPIVHAYNRSDYSIESLEVTLSCASEQVVTFSLILPHQKSEVGARRGGCSGAKMKITGGAWGRE